MPDDGTQAAFVVGLAAALGAALLYGVGAVVQARAVRVLGESDGLVSFVVRGIRSPLLVGVLAMYGGGFALHAVAIWYLPLYLAQAGIAASLPVTALCAAFVGERVSRARWFAVGLVVAGLMLLSAGAGHAGSSEATAPLALSIWVGVALLIAVSFAVRSGAALGALSGLAYAGCAIAVRPISTPVDVTVVACAVAVAVFGLLGFWLYSRGLARAEVSVATAPLVVGEVLGPTIVGLALLGDGVRAGWWPVVVLGVVLAIVGALRVGAEADEPADRVAA